MSLFQLIYVSSAIHDLADTELDRILESSLRHNTAQEVTGMLLYSNGNFVQVIEGDEVAIDETYARICEDPLHRDIHLLHREPIAEREFPIWSMGFRKLSKREFDAHPAYMTLQALGADTLNRDTRRGIAVSLLKQFCRGNT